MGQYLRNTPEVEPAINFVAYLAALRQRANEWDISHIIRVFAERRTTPQQSPTDYYGIIKELAKLNRTGMRQFKERFFLSMKMASSDKAVLPYRFEASTGCGFLFIPVRRSDGAERKKIMKALLSLNKHDLKLSRCVGLTFLWEENESSCDVQWGRVEYPWVETPQLDALLTEDSYPFRPMKESVVERYGFVSPED